jgi:hypothetical protein
MVAIMYVWRWVTLRSGVGMINVRTLDKLNEGTVGIGILIHRLSA